MSNDYHLSVMKDEFGNKVIDFQNKTGSFLEVVFEINGRNIKTSERGYCYPPYHHKPVRKLEDGSPLPLENHGEIKAYVFRGIGKLKEDETNYDVPPFIRFKLNEQRFHLTSDDLISKRQNKAYFKRTSNTPVAVLEIPY